MTHPHAEVSCGLACRTTFFLSAIQKEDKKITVQIKSLEFYALCFPVETKLARIFPMNC